MEEVAPRARTAALVSIASLCVSVCAASFYAESVISSLFLSKNAEISFSGLSWWTHTHLKTQKTSEEEIAAESAKIQIVEIKERNLKEPTLALSTRIKPSHPRVAKAAVSKKVVERTLARVISSQSLPVQAPVQETTKIQTEIPVVVTEHQAMIAIHSELLRRFEVAMNTQMNTQEQFAENLAPRTIDIRRIRGAEARVPAFEISSAQVRKIIFNYQREFAVTHKISNENVDLRSKPSALDPPTPHHNISEPVALPVVSTQSAPTRVQPVAQASEGPSKKDIQFALLANLRTSRMLANNKILVTTVKPPVPPAPPSKVDVPTNPPEVPDNKVPDQNKDNFSVSNKSDCIRDGGVEAFDPQARCVTTQLEVTSHEGKVKGMSSHWVRGYSSSKDHLPTIAWSGQLKDNVIPLISNNTLFAIKPKTTDVFPSAGVIFGKVRKDQLVKIGGRAEQTLYLNEQSGARDFIILNAEPGPQILQIETGAEERKIETGFAVPVFEGVASYIDLRESSVGTLEGFIQQTETGKAAANTSISVIGQFAKTITNNRGIYYLEKVYKLGNYPIYLDYSEPNGDTHRYCHSPDSSSRVNTLYTMSRKWVDGMIAQLEGGLNPNGGIAVGAVPNLVAEHEVGELIPTISTLSASNFKPETYTLNEGNHLLVHRPLEDRARFIGVQIPSGINLATIEDRGQKPVWSQLLISGPGVINMFEPN